MDHLPTIENPQYPRSQVPCLCSIEDYDGQGVRGFPERKGWTMDTYKGPVRTDGNEYSDLSRASLLQSWLYFGMLCDFFHMGGIHLQRSHFVYKVNDKEFITTGTLQRYISEWNKAVEIQTPNARQIHQCQLRECFKVVNIFFERYLNPTPTRDPAHPGRWSLLPHLELDIVLSILILGETLRNAANICWSDIGETPVLGPTGFVRRQNLLKDRLVRGGWCPSETAMLSDRLDNTGLYIASMLKRPFNVASEHTNCADHICVAHQINEETYQSAHADDCSDTLNCQHIFADEQKVCTILKSGSIPVIFLSPSNNDGSFLKIRVVDVNAIVLPFVAFSHVWAHGLGNVKANSLPYCQISRMKRLISELPFGMIGKDWGAAFWIDTLCIPVGPENKKYRKLAITRLAHTYRIASHVLVLDAELQRTSKRCSRTELATRILCSGWMRRLWTLQEAVVTESTPSCSKLKIQFIDGFMEFNSLMQRDLYSLYNSEFAILVVYSSIPQGTNEIRTFGLLANALEYRTTSKPEDEAICLASILGIKTDEIAELTTHEERMRLFYSCIRTLPSSILFHRAERLKLDGARWAPASLLGNHQFYAYKDGSLPATCSGQGLHVKYLGYIVLNVPRDGKQHSFYAKEPEEAHPSLWVTSLPTTALYFISSEFSNDPVAFGVTESRKFSKLMKETKTPGIIINPQDPGESALVAVTREENGVVYGKFLSIVSAKKPRMEAILSHKNWEKGLMHVRKLPADQQWCVG